MVHELFSTTHELSSIKKIFPNITSIIMAPKGMRLTRPTCSATKSLYRKILSPLDKNKKNTIKETKKSKANQFSPSLALPEIHRPRHHPRSRTDHRRRHRPRPLLSQPGQHGRSPPRSPPGALDGAGHFSAIVESGSGVGDFSHGYFS